MARITPMVQLRDDQMDASSYQAWVRARERDMTGIFDGELPDLEVQHYIDPISGERMRRVVERPRGAPPSPNHAQITAVEAARFIRENRPGRLDGEETMLRMTEMMRAEQEAHARRFARPVAVDFPTPIPGPVTPPPPPVQPPPVQPPPTTAPPRQRSTPFIGLSRRMEELRRIMQDPYSRHGGRYDMEQLIGEMMQVVGHACAAIDTEFTRWDAEKAEMTTRIEELESTIDLLNNEP